MALTPEIVEEFIAIEKVVTRDRRIAWRRRNLGHFFARVGVDAGGATVGELLLIAGVLANRDWTFKLLRRGEELLRWDLAAPPVRHSNPPDRPPGFPGKVRELEHEHIWVEGLGMNCAVPLDLGTTMADDHRQALAAFCDRANIDVQAPYDPPPPPGEQLQIE